MANHKCHTCREDITCSSCHGSGKQYAWARGYHAYDYDSFLPKSVYVEENCLSCWGSGRTNFHTCPPNWWQKKRNFFDIDGID